MFTISVNEGIKTKNKRGFYSGNKYIKKRLDKNNNWNRIQNSSPKIIYNGYKRKSKDYRNSKPIRINILGDYSNLNGFV